MDIVKLLESSAIKGASDIHLVVGLAPFFRIDGQLMPVGQHPVLTADDLVVFAGQLLNKEQEKRFREKLDLDFGYQSGRYRYRFNFSFEKNNIKIVARVISDKLPTIEEIGMPATLTELLALSQGLILVTGPTGCGKSTTLAAMINHINNSQSANIITLEDPIEYIFKSNKSIISQRQLGMDMISFNQGLKHVLRQDPNVIMVGEMRDLETIAAVMTLAETGHLVLATLHTCSAFQTVDRIIDIFPPHQQNQIKSQLANALTAVISQRLLPRQDGGRVACREILINNDAVANLIREGKIIQIKSIIETGASLGMMTMDKHIKQLYQEKIISPETATRSLENPDSLND